MKSIEISGRTFQYETEWTSFEGDSYPTTYFYSGVETYYARKYFLFGPKIAKTRPKVAFVIYDDSENERLGKSYWREKIAKEIELLNRKEEIERGELC
jgi:hypothetical protein